MNSNLSVRDIGKLLIGEMPRSISCITDDQTVTVDRTVHRHDACEVRLVFGDPVSFSELERLDVVLPQICHSRLADDENRRSYVLYLDPETQYSQRPGRQPEFVFSPHAVTLVNFLTRLPDEDFTEDKALELRLLTALFCVTACPAEQTGPMSRRIQVFARYLRIFYFRHDLSIAEAARLFGFSPRCVQKFFRDEFGVTPKDYLLRCRMEKAAALLLEKRFLVGETASLCGYADVHYFSNVFRRFYGCSPRRYAGLAGTAR